MDNGELNWDLFQEKFQNANKKQPSIGDYLDPTSVCKWKIGNNRIDYAENCDPESNPCFCSENSIYENYEGLLFSFGFCIICIAFIVNALYSVLFWKQSIDQEEYENKKDEIRIITEVIVNLDTTTLDYRQLGNLYGKYAELFFSLQHFKKEFPNRKIDHHLSQSLKRICKHLQSINCLSSEVDMYIKSFYSLFFIVDPSYAQDMLTKQYEIHMESQGFGENSVNTHLQGFKENPLNTQIENPEDFVDKMLIVEHDSNSNSHRITIVNTEQAVNYILPIAKVIIQQEIIVPITQLITYGFKQVVNVFSGGLYEMKSEIHQVKTTTEELKEISLRQEKEGKIRQKSKVVHRISKYLFLVFIPFIIVQCINIENILQVITELWEYLKELVMSMIHYFQDSGWMKNQSHMNRILVYSGMMCFVAMNFSTILQKMLSLFTAYFLYLLPFIAVVLQYHFKSMAIWLSICLIILWVVFYIWGGKNTWIRWLNPILMVSISYCYYYYAFLNVC